MQLIIAEKPSVAQSIAQVLGATTRKDGYFTGSGCIVSWCIGHLVELAQPTAYDEKHRKWSREHLPIIPREWQYVVSKGKDKQVKTLGGLMASPDVDTIVCATDAGREGQLIFQLVYDWCRCTKPVKRLWISSMEESAIAEGFATLRDGAEYENLYRSALCRAQADWLVGINATRLFSCHFGQTLNVGRVMTPTLAMVVEREARIAGFAPMPFYIVKLALGEFEAASEKMVDKAAAGAVVAACQDQPAIVASVDVQEKAANPPKLYDLTSLQRDANRLFDFTAQQTLDYAQALYEKKLLTYPRTDSKYLTEDMRASAGSVATWLQMNRPYMGDIRYTPLMDGVTDNTKVSDHHGIIPTSEIAGADVAALPAGERNILMLVEARLLCATAEPHQYTATEATLICAEHKFTAKGKTVLREGWRAVQRAALGALKAKREDTEEPCALPPLAEGQEIMAGATLHEGKTSPPKHFTEVIFCEV